MAGDYGFAFTNALLFTLIGVCFAMPVLRILGAWMLDRTISTAVALSSLLILFSLMGISWKFGGPPWALVYILLVTISNLCFPWFSGWMDKASLGRMRHDDMTKYRRAIEQDPRNAAAHEYLADALLENRRYDEAIAEYEIVISLSSNGAATHERWKLKRAHAAKERRARELSQVCAKCDTTCSIEHDVCVYCGSPLKKTLRTRLTYSSQRYSATQYLLAFAVVLPVFFIIFAPLPVLAKIWMLFLGAIVGGYFLLKKVGGD